MVGVEVAEEVDLAGDWCARETVDDDTRPLDCLERRQRSLRAAAPASSAPPAPSCRLTATTLRVAFPATFPATFSAAFPAAFPAAFAVADEVGGPLQATWLGLRVTVRVRIEG